MYNVSEEGVYEYRPMRVRLSLRTDYIFFPVDSDDFAKTIEAQGYEVKTAPQTMGPIRLEIPGQLAVKEGCNIQLDTNRQILGVDGDSPQRVIEIFEELEGIIIDDMKIDYRDSIKFYETIIDYHIYSPKNPREIIENALKDTKLERVLSTLLGIEVAPFTLRYASKERLPNSTEWMDLRIEPFVRRADKIYAFNVVHRSAEGEEVKKTLQSIQDIMASVVKEIET